ncbi:hypothetical protein [Saccharothrix sp. HUAS TT1]|uniref:hypothetical protein n=1 Tax=unclassified Saccharothrix TaxID=2593673 RepID=UPI00345C53EB
MTTTEINGHHANGRAVNGHPVNGGAANGHGTDGTTPAGYLPYQGGAGLGQASAQFTGGPTAPDRPAYGPSPVYGQPQQTGGYGQQGYGQPQQPASALLRGIPDPRELDAAIVHANEVAAKQGAAALSGAMTWEEHEDKRRREEALRLFSRQVDERIEAARIDVERELAEVDLAVRRAEVEAKAEQARIEHEATLRRIRHEAEIAVIEQDDEHAAAKQQAEQRGKDAKAAAEANERLREHTDATKKLAVQARRRALTVRGFVAVSVIAVAGGAYNVSDTVGRLLNVPAWSFGRFALGILEPLATIPLALILLARLSIVVTEGLRAREQAAPAATGMSAWLHRRFGDTEWRYEVLFLGVAVALNTVPHMMLNEWKAVPLWLWVPCALACALRLGGHLVRKYDDAMLDLVLDAQMSAPVGPLSPEVAKLFRQVREIGLRRAAGTLRGELQPNGLPSLSGTVKTLKEFQPTAPVREGQAVIAGMSILEGIEK